MESVGGGRVVKQFCVNLQSVLQASATLSYVGDVLVTNRSSIDLKAVRNYCITIWPLKEEESYLLARTTRKTLVVGLGCWMKSSDNPSTTVLGGVLPKSLPEFVEDVKSVLRGTTLNGYILPARAQDRTQGVQSAWLYQDKATSDTALYGAVGAFGGEREIAF